MERERPVWKITANAAYMSHLESGCVFGAIILDDMGKWVSKIVTKKGNDMMIGRFQNKEMAMWMTEIFYVAEWSYNPPKGRKNNDNQV